MTHVRRPLNIYFTLRSREYGFYISRVPFRRLAGSTVGVDEDFDTLVALGLAIGAVEEAREPGCGEGGGGAGGGVEGVVYVGDADGGLGGGFRVVDCQVDFGQGSPEDVEKGNRAGGFGFCGEKRRVSIAGWYKKAVAGTDADRREKTYS